MTDETYELLDEAVQIQLKRIKSFNLDTKESKEALAKANHLVELLITADKDSADYYDKKERRRIEEEKNKAANIIERDKQKITIGRFAFEMARVIVPTIVTFIGYDIFQRRVLKFEETGRLTSTASRWLGLPKFMK